MTFPDRPSSSAPRPCHWSFDVTLLVVVVALLEMSLGVFVAAGHRANRKHRATLWLFEIRDQEEGRRMRENSRVCFLTVGRLWVLEGCGFCPFAVPDLLGREPASANAAAPARRSRLRDYWRWLPIRVPGSHQFATAMWTISSNHKVRRRNVSRCAMRDQLAGWMVRASSAVSREGSQ